MGVAEAIPSEPSANRNAAFRCIYEMEHEAMSDNESVINNLDAWRANLNILIQHLDAADKDASREAVFILLLQGLGIFGGPERPMSHLFPVVDSITDCDTREALALRSDSTRAAQGALVNGLVSALAPRPSRPIKSGSSTRPRTRPTEPCTRPSRNSRSTPKGSPPGAWGASCCAPSALSTEGGVWASKIPSVLVHVFGSSARSPNKVSLKFLKVGAFEPHEGQPSPKRSAPSVDVQERPGRLAYLNALSPSHHCSGPGLGLSA